MCHLLFFFTTYILCHFMFDVLDNCAGYGYTIYWLLHTVNARAIFLDQRHEISGDGGFSNVYSAASLCCAVSVVIMGFYLFPWHMDEGLHRAFVASHTISSCLCVAQRHEFDAKGRISPWPESAPHHPTGPLHFSFVSLSIFSFSFSSFCIFLPAPQHRSLMFTYSLIQNNKLKLYSLQPVRLLSLSLSFSFLFCLPACPFFPFTCGPHDLSVGTLKKMQDAEEMKWHIENGIVGR